MRLSKRGAAFLRAHEGFVPRYYLDPVGIGTIGVGFTWASSSFRDWWAKNRPGQKFGPGATMTAAEADSCLVYLCDAEYGAAVNKFLAGKVVEQHVFDAMCSMVFNCGPGALEWRWAAFVKAGNMVAAAKAWKETATTAKGKKLPGLVRRRKEEAELAQYARYAGVAATVANEPPAIPIPEPKPSAAVARTELGLGPREIPGAQPTSAPPIPAADASAAGGCSAKSGSLGINPKPSETSVFTPKTPDLGITSPAKIEQGPVPSGGWLSALLAVLASFFRGRSNG